MSAAADAHGSEPPLVTLLLVAFNHERFVAEAARAALAQDYPRLEIICSDDGSADATYERLCRECEGYTGPHALVVRRNERNLGWAPHLNALMGMARGELVVVAAADDVSLPDRCSALVEAWERHGRPVASLYSAFEAIDEEGSSLGLDAIPLPRTLEEGLVRPQQGVTGATHAWSRRLFEIFGPLPPGIVYEDRCLQYRAMLLDGVVFVSRPLVRYRLTGASLSRHAASGYREAMARAAANHRRLADVYAAFIADVETARQAGMVDAGTAGRLAGLARGQAALAAAKAQFLAAGWASRVRIFLAQAARVPPAQAAKWALLLVAPWTFNLRLPRRKQAT